MKKCLLVLLTLVTLSGCSVKQSLTHDTTNALVGRIDDAEQSLNNLEQNLAPECKTAVIVAEIDAQKRNYKRLVDDAKNIESSCTTEKKALEAIITTWKTRTYALLVFLLSILGLFVYRKFFKPLS